MKNYGIDMNEHEWRSLQWEKKCRILTDAASSGEGLCITEVLEYIAEEGWDDDDDPIPDGNIILPDSLEGCPLVEIRENAFQYNAPVSLLHLPENIRIIEKNAFDGSCIIHKLPDKLENVYEYAFNGITFQEDGFPQHLQIIGDCAFMSCDGLKDVRLPEGLQLIGDNAFSNCQDLEQIWFPASLEVVGEGILGKCLNLKTIHLDTDNKELSLVDGVLIRNSDKTAVAWVPKDSSGICRIPYGVERIGDETFLGRKDLRIVYLPDTVKEIGMDAWGNCSSLQEICFGNGLVSIETIAFRLCTSLKSINLPGNFKSIGEEAFYGCSSLKKITLPDSLEYIGQEAFVGCDNLKEVETSYRALADNIISGFGVASTYGTAWKAPKCKNR